MDDDDDWGSNDCLDLSWLLDDEDVDDDVDDEANDVTNGLGLSMFKALDASARISMLSMSVILFYEKSLNQSVI